MFKTDNAAMQQSCGEKGSMTRATHQDSSINTPADANFESFVCAIF